MKQILVLMLAMLVLSPSVMAGGKNKKKAQKAQGAAAGNDEIRWMTIDEVQVAMKKEPKKVFMDVYTDWCGWCKVMDKKTFSNKNVARYINEKFYAVKLDAERKDSVRFMGKMFGFVPENRAHQLAVELLRGQMSYPTSVILEENFQNPQPVPGYLDVPTIQSILTYLGENTYKTKPWPEFQKEFKPTWTANPDEGNAAPVAGH